jgi:phage baseplate assembly protein W
MPIQRVSQSFIDISLSLGRNPLNRDVVDLKNERAIARSIQNLVLTQRGERPFSQNLGSDVSVSLFENVDFISAAVIQSSIENVIRTYEPRVNLQRVNVNLNEDGTGYYVDIVYEIIGIEAQPQQLEFALQQTR